MSSNFLRRLLESRAFQDYLDSHNKLWDADDRQKQLRQLGVTDGAAPAPQLAISRDDLGGVNGVNAFRRSRSPEADLDRLIAKVEGAKDYQRAERLKSWRQEFRFQRSEIDNGLRTNFDNIQKSVEAQKPEAPIKKQDYLVPLQTLEVQASKSSTPAAGSTPAPETAPSPQAVGGTPEEKEVTHYKNVRQSARDRVASLEKSDPNNPQIRLIQKKMDDLQRVTSDSNLDKDQKDIRRAPLIKELEGLLSSPKSQKSSEPTSGQGQQQPTSQGGSAGAGAAPQSTGTPLPPMVEPGVKSAVDALNKTTKPFQRTLTDREREQRANDARTAPRGAGQTPSSAQAKELGLQYGGGSLYYDRETGQEYKTIDGKLTKLDGKFRRLVGGNRNPDEKGGNSPQRLGRETSKPSLPTATAIKSRTDEFFADNYFKDYKKTISKFLPKEAQQDDDFIYFIRKTQPNLTEPNRETGKKYLVSDIKPKITKAYAKYRNEGFMSLFPEYQNSPIFKALGSPKKYSDYIAAYEELEDAYTKDRKSKYDLRYIDLGGPYGDRNKSVLAYLNGDEEADESLQKALSDKKRIETDRGRVKVTSEFEKKNRDDLGIPLGVIERLRNNVPAYRNPMELDNKNVRKQAEKDGLRYVGRNLYADEEGNIVAKSHYRKLPGGDQAGTIDELQYLDKEELEQVENAKSAFILDKLGINDTVSNQYGWAELKNGKLQMNKAKRGEAKVSMADKLRSQGFDIGEFGKVYKNGEYAGRIVDGAFIPALDDEEASSRTRTGQVDPTVQSAVDSLNKTIPGGPTPKPKRPTSSGEGSSDKSDGVRRDGRGYLRDRLGRYAGSTKKDSEGTIDASDVLVPGGVSQPKKDKKSSIGSRLTSARNPVTGQTASQQSRRSLKLKGDPDARSVTNPFARRNTKDPNLQAQLDSASKRLSEIRKRMKELFEKIKKEKNPQVKEMLKKLLEGEDRKLGQAYITLERISQISGLTNDISNQNFNRMKDLFSDTEKMSIQAAQDHGGTPQIFKAIAAVEKSTGGNSAFKEMFRDSSETQKRIKDTMNKMASEKDADYDMYSDSFENPNDDDLDADVGNVDRVSTDVMDLGDSSGDFDPSTPSSDSTPEERTNNQSKRVVSKYQAAQEELLDIAAELPDTEVYQRKYDIAQNMLLMALNDRRLEASGGEVTEKKPSELNVDSAFSTLDADENTDKLIKGVNGINQNDDIQNMQQMSDRLYSLAGKRGSKEEKYYAGVLLNKAFQNQEMISKDNLMRALTKPSDSDKQILRKFVNKAQELNQQVPIKDNSSSKTDGQEFLNKLNSNVNVRTDSLKTSTDGSDPDSSNLPNVKSMEANLYQMLIKGFGKKKLPKNVTDDTIINYVHDFMKGTQNNPPGGDIPTEKEMVKQYSLDQLESLMKYTPEKMTDQMVQRYKTLAQKESDQKSANQSDKKKDEPKGGTIDFGESYCIIQWRNKVLNELLELDSKLIKESRFIHESVIGGSLTSYHRDINKEIDFFCSPESTPYISEILDFYNSLSGEHKLNYRLAQTEFVATNPYYTIHEKVVVAIQTDVMPERRLSQIQNPATQSIQLENQLFESSSFLEALVDVSLECVSECGCEQEKQVEKEPQPTYSVPQPTYSAPQQSHLPKITGRKRLSLSSFKRK